MPPPKLSGTPSADIFADLPDVGPPPAADIFADLPDISARPLSVGGLRTPGNIDLSTRPIVRNPDGSVSTIRSMSFGTDQGEVLVPTVVNGRVVSNQEAIDHYRRTGEHLGIFDTPESATAAAERLHQEEARRVAPFSGTVRFDRPDPRQLLSPLEQEVVRTSPPSMDGGRTPSNIPSPPKVDVPLAARTLDEARKGFMGGAVGAVARPIASATLALFDDKTGLNAINRQLQEYGSEALSADDWYLRPDAYANLAGSIVGSVAGFTAMSFGPGGPLRAALGESFVEAANKYADLREEGKDEGAARAGAALSLAANFALLKVTNLPLFERLGGAKTTAALRSLSEGTQEAGQEIIGNVIQNPDDPSTWLQNTGQSFLAGALAGPIMGESHDVADAKTKADEAVDDLATREPLAHTSAARSEPASAPPEAPVTFREGGQVPETPGQVLANPPTPSMAELVRSRVAESAAARQASQFPVEQPLPQGAAPENVSSAPSPELTISGSLPSNEVAKPEADIFADLPNVKPFATEVTHITTPEAADAILREGFDLSRAGSGLGSQYGPGVYLSDRATDSAGFWRQQLATKNETGEVPTVALGGDARLERPLELTMFNRAGQPTGDIAKVLSQDAPHLVQPYQAAIEAGASSHEAIGQVARAAGYDGIVFNRTAGQEIIAFDPKAVTFTRRDGQPIGEAATPPDPFVDLPNIESPDKYDYSSTQVNLPPEVAGRVFRFAEAIPDEDLAPDGRESQPHITIQYGIDTGDVSAVEKALANEPPVTVTFGKTSLFENEDADVVKVDVDSPDLRRLRKKVAEVVNTPGDTHPSYIPHVTIAYVKPGKGKAYADNAALEGQSVTVDRVIFSSKDGGQVEIPLTGTPKKFSPRSKPEPVTSTTMKPPAAPLGTADTPSAEATPAAPSTPVKTWAQMSPEERAAEIARRLEAKRRDATPPTDGELRGATMSQRNEQRRRQEQAPLLDASGVLPPVPSTEELVAKKRAGDELQAEVGAQEQAHAERRANQFDALAQALIPAAEIDPVPAFAGDGVEHRTSTVWSQLRERFGATHEDYADITRRMDAGEDIADIARAFRHTHPTYRSPMDLARERVRKQWGEKPLDRLQKFAENAKAVADAKPNVPSYRAEADAARELLDARQFSGGRDKAREADAVVVTKDTFRPSFPTPREEREADTEPHAKWSDWSDEDLRKAIQRDETQLAQLRTQLKKSKYPEHYASSIKGFEDSRAERQAELDRREALNAKAETPAAPPDVAPRASKMPRSGAKKAEAAPPVAAAPPKAPFTPRSGAAPNTARLRQSAENLSKTIAEKRNPAIGQQRLTRRRADIAESMGRDADRLERVQKTALAIADAIDAGTLPDVLKKVASVAAIERILLNQGTKDEREAIRAYEPGKAEPDKDSAIKAKIRALIGTKIPGFFPTPQPLIEKIISYSAYAGRTDSQGLRLLEPSAGKGDIADAMREEWPDANILTVEHNQTLHELLDLKGLKPVARDFLTYQPGPVFDGIYMNPPFEKGADIEHVQHAYELLKPGGELIAVMSTGPFSRGDKKAETFRAWFKAKDGVEVERNDGMFNGAQSFRQTGVSTVLVQMTKPEASKQTQPAAVARGKNPRSEFQGVTLEQRLSDAKFLVVDDDLPQLHHKAFATKEAAASAAKQARAERDAFVKDVQRIGDERKGVTSPQQPTRGEAMWFRSGIATAPADFDGFAQAGVPIGVTADVMSPSIEQRVIDYVSRGGQVFVDSGAFGHFKKGTSPDFDKVLALYRRLAKAIPVERHSGLYVVAPDIVGDAAGSRNLQQRYAPEYQRLSNDHVKVVVPAQVGQAGSDIHEALKWIARTFSSNAIAGLPSNEEAIDLDRLVEYFSTMDVPVNGVHFLGAQPARLERVLKVLRNYQPGIAVTSDSNRVSSMVGTDRPAGKAMQQAREDAGFDALQRPDTPDVDETELAGAVANGDMHALTGVEWKLLADRLGSTRTEVRKALRSPDAEVRQVISDDPRYDLAIAAIVRARAERQAGPGIRRDAIAAREQGGPLFGAGDTNTNNPSSPGKVDINEFGEAQPRLPGADTVREDALKPEPKFEAPFALQAETDAGAQAEDQGGLFGAPTTPERIAKLQADRQKLLAQKDQALQELRDSLFKTTSGIDPTALVPMTKLLDAYVKLGLNTVELAWAEFKEDWKKVNSPIAADELRDAFDIGWEMAHEGDAGVSSEEDDDAKPTGRATRTRGTRGGRSARAGRGGSDRERPPTPGPLDRGAGGDGARGPSPTLVTAREDLTPRGDASLVPADLADRLFPHQVDGAALALAAMDAHGGFLLADGTGAGKTSQELAVAERYRRQGKSVLIITKAEVIKPDWAKQTMSGSFVKDAARMGVTLTLGRSQEQVAPGTITVSTYDNLEKIQHADVVIFDESHALKNAESGRGIAGIDLANGADAVLFASATPADKPIHIPYLARMGMLEGQSPRMALEKLGLREREKETARGKKIRYYQQTLPAIEVHKRMAALFDRMTQAGRMVKREISMRGVQVSITRIELPEDTKATLRTIENAFGGLEQAKGLQRARILMHQRRQQEPAKLDTAMTMIREELDAGRQVVLFASRVNASEVKKWVKDPLTRERYQVTITESEGTLKTLRQQLADEDIPYSELHGAAEEKPDEAMAAFQSGQSRVLIATIESGGTGINLDDVTGHAPRTMIILTAPFSAVENVQAAGRVWRVTTKSLPRIRYIFGDTYVDQWNSSIIASKMQALGATVQGEVQRLDPALIEFADVTDEDVAPPSAPTEPEPLVDQQGWTKGAIGAWRVNDRGNVEARFTAMPPSDVRERLKAAGFRWFAMDKVWYAKTTDATKAAAQTAVGATAAIDAEGHGSLAEDRTWERTLAQAREQGYTGPEDALRQAYQEMVARAVYMREYASDEEDRPQDLFAAIAAAGGIGRDAMYAGEVDQLWEESPGYVRTNYKGAGKTRTDTYGRVITPKRYRKMPYGSLAGVAKVLRNDGGGLSLDHMAEALRQNRQYGDIGSPNDLLARIDQALTAAKAKRSTIAFTPYAGWWQDLLTDDGRPVGAIARAEAEDVPDWVADDTAEDIDEPGSFASVGSVAKLGAGRPGKLPPTGNQGGTVQPVEFPELVALAKRLTGTPKVVRAFRNPGKSGEFRSTGEIRLAARLFTPGNEADLAATLAHEIGHLIDWLPDNVLKRGNLLGHLQTLRGFLKHTFSGPLGDIKLADVRDELLTLSFAWRPLDPNGSASYMAYRRSSKELYADAISVLLNDPGRLEAEAPRFYKEFFAALHKKPDVQAAFADLQALLNAPPEKVVETRRGAFRSMVESGDARAAELKRASQKRLRDRGRDLWTALKLHTVNKDAPFTDRAKRLEKAGTRIPAPIDPRGLLDERRYVGGKLKAWVQRHVDPLKRQLEGLGIDWHTFGEALFYERIIAGDRSELANPLGLSPETARRSYDDLKDKLDPSQRQALADALSMYRKAVKAVARQAYDAGLFTDEQWDLIEKNPAYATFQVIEHLDKAVTSRIKHQIGTLKDITNPANAMALKTLVTLRAIEHQQVKRAAFGFLEQFDPDAAKPAATKWNGKAHEPIDPPRDSGLALVTYFEKGQYVGKWVDPYIASSLENEQIGHNWAVIRILRSANSVFRPLFTGLNLGFQLFNLPRDFWRFYFNTPSMSFGRALKRYYQGAGLARVRAFGQPRATTAASRAAYEDLLQAQETGIFGQTFNDLAHGREIEDTQIDDILASAGLGPPSAPTSRLKRYQDVIWRKVFEPLEKIGDYIETLPKAAAIEEFRRTPQGQRGAVRDLSAPTRSFIRRKVGSPDFKSGGTWTPVTNNVFLFSNAIIQGWRADLEVATDPTTRAGWWWKRAAVTFLPKALYAAALMAAAGAGGDDDDKDLGWLKDIGELLQNVSEYDLTNYMVLPLGRTADGKTAYVRIPQDDTGRFLGGLFWKALHLAKGDDQDLSAMLRDVASYTSGQFPSVTPAIGVPVSIAEYVSGQNPYDAFRGRNVLTDDEQAARDSHTLKKFLGWEFQELGGGIVWRFVPGESRPRQKDSLEGFLDLPVVSNIAGRVLRVSDFGQTEGLRAARKETERDEARRRLAKTEAVNDALKHEGSMLTTRGGQYAKAREIAAKVYPNADKATLNEQTHNIQRSLAMGLIRYEADPLTNEVLAARSNAQRIAILRKAKRGMSAEDWTRWRDHAKTEHVLSAEVDRALRAPSSLPR